MFYVLLAVLYCASRSTVVSTTECEPSKYLCSGICPRLPDGLHLQSEPICVKDLESDACVCWLHNPTSQLQSIFRCEVRINGTVSQVMCNPPPDCFSPDPNGPVCIVILQCQCLPLDTDSRIVYENWQRVKATVHTKEKPSSQDHEGQSIEKVQDEIREFRLKHLLFLIGFVIAPLLCWCLLNFFHEGKCRKKASDPPEAQPIPTSRCSTVDNMNNNEDVCSDRSCQEVVIVSPSTETRCFSVRSNSVPVLVPTAPEDAENVECSRAQQQTLLKNESPPPYTESMGQSFNTDFGPPPTYEDAIRGTDINVQQLWQTVFVLQPVSGEDV